MLPVVALVLLATACASAGHPQTSPSLVGIWEGDGMVLNLRADGTGTWTVPAVPDGFEVTWTFDASDRPFHFDLSGFESGPLAGKTLYGIVMMPDRDTLRWDAEPGPAGGDGASVRPSQLMPDDTRTLRRRRV